MKNKNTEDYMETKIVYFEKLGSENTDKTLALAYQRAKELGIKKIVVASSTGDTGVRALKLFKDVQTIIVTHSIGDIVPNASRFAEEHRRFLDENGAITVRTTDPVVGICETLGGGPTHGVEDHHTTSMAVPSKLGSSPGELIASSLGFFCRGMKVACSIIFHAADAGVIRTDEEVISVAGTRYGADIAIVVQPTNSHTFQNLKVKEIICKPLTHPSVAPR